MAWLEPQALFDPDRFDAPLLGIAATLGDHDSGLHRHRRGQLLYTRQGLHADHPGPSPVPAAALAGGVDSPGVTHRAQMQQSVDYRSLYFSAELSRRLPAEVAVIEVSPLLQAVLEPMAQAAFDCDWSQGRYPHLLGLCIEEIRQALHQPLSLPLPRDKRLQPLLANLEQLPPQLQVLATRVGASSRTIGRIFQRETGLSYQQWRQQWRLMRAIELLATGRGIGYSACALGFASDSIFIAFFKAMTGTTPRAYFK